MLAIDVGSVVVGAMLGTIALAYFAYFVRELHRGRVVKAAPAMAISVLAGTAIAQRADRSLRSQPNAVAVVLHW